MLNKCVFTPLGMEPGAPVSTLSSPDHPLGPAVGFGARYSTPLSFDFLIYHVGITGPSHRVLRTKREINGSTTR